MNNMGDSMGPDEQSHGGISRRDMIKASVIAGGLVWSAPVLLTGKAAAAEGDPCCENGTPVTVKVSETQGVNCGVACLSSQAEFNFDCPPDLVNCLGELELVVGDFNAMGADTAVITLAAGVTLIAAGVKASNRCYFALGCCFPSTRDDPTCANTCELSNGNDCGVMIPPNRIWVQPDPDPDNVGGTKIFIDTHAAPDGVLNHVELSLCIAPEITALCP